MPHADSPTCSMGLIQTRQGGWQRRSARPPSSLSASPGGPPTHTAAAATRSSPLHLRLLPLPPSSFTLVPRSFRPPSPSGFEPLWRGVMFTPLLHRLDCRPGPASCCSSNSIVLNSDVGRIKLVIFQAWSVLVRQPSGSVRRLQKGKRSGKRKQKRCCFVYLLLNVRRLFPLKCERTTLRLYPSVNSTSLRSFFPHPDSIISWRN